MARRQPRLPPGRDRSRRRLERADLDGRADRCASTPAPLARSLAERSSRAADSEWLRRVAAPPTRPPSGAIDAFLDALGDELFEPRVYRDARARCFRPAARSTSPPACRCATSRRSSRAVDRAAALPRQPRRERHRRAGLLGPRRRSGRARRATFVLIGDVGLYHDMNGLLAMQPPRRRGDDRRDEQRRRRDLRLPADRRAPRRLRGAVRHPDRASTSSRSRRCTGCRSRGSARYADLARRSPGRGWWRSRSTARATSSCTASCSQRVADGGRHGATGLSQRSSADRRQAPVSTGSSAWSLTSVSASSASGSESATTPTPA